MQFLYLTVALTAAVPAVAHELYDVEISSFSRSAISGIYTIELSNTVKGRKVVCAMYDADGKLLKSTSATTDNLATGVHMVYRGADVDAARCVYND